MSSEAPEDAPALPEPPIFGIDGQEMASDPMQRSKPMAEAGDVTVNLTMDTEVIRFITGKLARLESKLDTLLELQQKPEPKAPRGMWDGKVETKP